ncbi:MAG: hypothetical protein ACRERR_02215 [Moraxellaceae bacterium]
MSQTEEKKKTALIALIALGVIASCIEGYLGLKGAPTSGKVMTIWALSFAFLTAYWVTLDANLRQIHGPYTRGFIMYFFWPVMIPSYLIKTHGPKGLLLTAAFFVAFVFPETFWLVADSLQ